MRFLTFGVCVLWAAFVVDAGATCFSVYDQEQKLVYRHSESPVDLSLRIGDTVPSRFGPGAAMVMAPGADDCAPVVGAQSARPSVNDVLASLEVPAAYSGLGLGGARGGTGFGGGYGRGGAGAIHVGPRGGVYRLTGSGNRSYLPRGRR